MSELDLLSFRTLIDQAVVPARRHLREIFLPVALPLVVCILAVTLAQVAWMRTVVAVDPSNLGPFFAGFAAMMGLILVTMAVYMVTFGALVQGAMQAIEGEPRVRMGRAYAWVLRPRNLGTLALVSLASFASMMALFFPALYVVPRLSLVLPVMAAEGRSGGDAFRRAGELFAHNPSGRPAHSPWLQVGGLLVVGWIFQYALSLAAQLPFLVAQQIILLRDPELVQDPFAPMTRLAWLQVPAGVLGALATTAGWLYLAFGLALLFRELRRRREAPDLVAAVDRLTGADAGGSEAVAGSMA